jgi:Ca2+-binding RTX toxin-like protein
MPLSSTQEVIVNLTTSGRQEFSDVHARKAGFITTWRALDGDPNLRDFNIYVRALDAQGQPIGSEINLTGAGRQSQPSIATNSKGKSLVTWWALDDATGQLDYNVYGRIVNKLGNPIGEQFRINSTNVPATNNGQFVSDQLLPKAAALTNGGFVVVFQSSEPASLDIRGRLFDSNGRAVGKDFVVNSKTPEAQQFADVVALNNGGFMVTWSSAENPTTEQVKQYDVRARIFDRNGSAVSKDFIVNTEKASNQFEPVVRQLVDGNIVVAWNTNNATNTNPDVKAQMYSASGKAIGGEFAINETTAGGQGQVDITALADGRFLAVWASEEAGSIEIRARIFGAQGTALSPDFIVNNNTAFEQSDPHVSLMSDGRVALSFTSFANGSDANVHTMILNPYFYNGTSVGESYRGGSLKDTIFGNDGADALIGKKGNDYVNGGNGDDFVVGGKGLDKLIGGNGADTLAGGGDADKLMYFSPSDGGDTVLGFAAGDRFVFDSAAFGFGGATGKLANNFFRKGVAAVDADDRFIFTGATGQLWFDADGNGEGAQVLIADLDNSYKLTASDITLTFLAV